MEDIITVVISGGLVEEVTINGKAVPAAIHDYDIDNYVYEDNLKEDIDGYEYVEVLLTGDD